MALAWEVERLRFWAVSGFPGILTATGGGRRSRVLSLMLTTTVGSYPVPDWLQALPSEQAVTDAT
ncbi:MAG: hypothetical protein P8J87_15085, partial [Verrucomicrobiales bacterium]|nr:hypothetical protein [Verrucomicrobiales bacterium]